MSKTGGAASKKGGKSVAAKAAALAAATPPSVPLKCIPLTPRPPYFAVPDDERTHGDYGVPWHSSPLFSLIWSPLTHTPQLRYAQPLLLDRSLRLHRHVQSKFERLTLYAESSRNESFELTLILPEEKTNAHGNAHGNGNAGANAHANAHANASESLLPTVAGAAAAKSGKTKGKSRENKMTFGTPNMSRTQYERDDKKSSDIQGWGLVGWCIGCSSAVYHASGVAFLLYHHPHP